MYLSEVQILLGSNATRSESPLGGTKAAELSCQIIN